MSTNLTCSEMSSVVPASSSHLPKNSSPRNGFNGFFSLPYLSLRLAYCCFKVLRNHFSTRSARRCGSFSWAGATKIEGCSAQYDENSTSDFADSMKGGAVKDDKSPENEAKDWACQFPTIKCSCEHEALPLEMRSMIPYWRQRRLLQVHL